MTPLGITREGALYYLPSPLDRANIQIAELDEAGKSKQAPAIGAERYQNANNHPVWSPDGKSLVYVSYRGVAPQHPGSTLLVVKSLETGEERDIPLKFHVAWGSNAATPRWFPDGRSVLAVAPDSQRPRVSYYRVTLATGEAELLYTTERNGSADGPDLSPDGKSLFWADLSGLIRFDLETRKRTQLKPSPPNQDFNSVALSPDGHRLAYWRSDGSAHARFLEIVPSSGGESREVLHFDYEGAPGLAWTPDQRSLLFVQWQRDPKPPVLKSAVWRVPVTGGAPESTGVSVTGILNSLGVHPGGRRIVFGVRAGSQDELWALENFLPAKP